MFFLNASAQLEKQLFLKIKKPYFGTHQLTSFSFLTLNFHSSPLEKNTSLLIEVCRQKVSSHIECVGWIVCSRVNGSNVTLSRQTLISRFILSIWKMPILQTSHPVILVCSSCWSSGRLLKGMVRLRDFWNVSQSPTILKQFSFCDEYANQLS